MSKIPQLKLFEVEDQRWLPPSLRDGITNYLSWLGNVSPTPYIEFSTALADAMKATGDDHVVDLCAGASGPWIRLLPLLEGRGLNPRVVLTDLFPNLPAMQRAANASEGRIRYITEPVDATAVPPELAGFRVLFNAFHHFRSDAAKSILRDATRHRRGIAIFEGVERSIPSILACMSSVGIVPFATPFIRPFSWRQIALTYLVPAVPVCAAWDGVVSSFRCYTTSELLSIAQDIAPDYHWQARRCPIGRSPLASTYLIGHPSQRPAHA